jgi:hypothetical protein
MKKYNILQYYTYYGGQIWVKVEEKTVQNVARTIGNPERGHQPENGDVATVTT